MPEDRVTLAASPSRVLLECFFGLAAIAAACVISLPLRPPEAAQSPGPFGAEQASGEVMAPDPVASYTLRARLDPQRHRVFATGTIHFKNTTNSSLNSLFFHLYLNAFKNDRTLFLRSPFGVGRSGDRIREFGYIDVLSLRARELENTDLWPGRVRHSPLDPEDETDIEVPLPMPLAAGGELTLDVSFEAQLPELLERTGYKESFHFVAQWFPKLSRLEPDGRFAHFAFHPQAEFYADFGNYDVTLDVPEAFRVGASGQPVEDRVEKGRRKVRYVAEGVHDFAWTAWDGFVESRARVGAVDVSLLAPSGLGGVYEQTLSTVRFALPYLASRLGSYPYRRLTLVHPPATAAAAGGMEYPTLITTGVPWYLPYTGIRALEAVTVHELGHQWFYGLIASNEAKAPFLDEGLNSYVEGTVLDAAFGSSSAFRGFGLELASSSISRLFSTSRAEDEPIAQEARSFTSFANLGALVYGRTTILLETIARVYGRERLDRALFDYAIRYRYRHPQAEDFLEVMRKSLGNEAAALLRIGLFERGTVNYVIRDIQNVRDQAPAGFFERPSGRERIARTTPPESRYRAQITVYRHGSLAFPVEVLLVAEDGTRKIEHWDGHGYSTSFGYSGRTPLAFAVIDPKRRILIDDDLFDNHAATEEAGLGRVDERLTYFAALALFGVAP